MRTEVARLARLRLELPIVRAFVQRVEARLNQPADRQTGAPPTWEPPGEVPGGDQYRRAVQAELQAMQAELEGKRS